MCSRARHGVLLDAWCTVETRSRQSLRPERTRSNPRAGHRCDGRLTGQNSGRETCVADAAAVLAQSEVVGVEIGEFEAVVEDTKTDEQSRLIREIRGLSEVALARVDADAAARGLSRHVTVRGPVCERHAGWCLATAGAARPKSTNAGMLQATTSRQAARRVQCRALSPNAATGLD